MFGVAFKEQACLINRSEEGLCLKLLRPVAIGALLEISFSPNCPELSFWIDVKVAWINYRLDGYQSIGVKARSLSLLDDWLKWKATKQPLDDKS